MRQPDPLRSLSYRFYLDVELACLCMPMKLRRSRIHIYLSSIDRDN